MRAFLIALLLCCAPLFAQDEAETRVDLAVAYPTTTLVYMCVDVDGYLESLDFKELLSGLDGASRLPRLGDLLRDRVELPLTDAEVDHLLHGVRGVSFGLLDVAVSGPRMQVVIEHRDLSALSRALKQASDDRAISFVDVEDYYGVPVYQLEPPRSISEVQTNPWAMPNPMLDWVGNYNLWVAVHDGRQLVMATSLSAVKDAIDFLSYPEDPVDTLLGNSRYKEALSEFKGQQLTLFVNVQSVINTFERAAGDGGTGGIFGMLVRELLRQYPESGQFFVSLVQYEQLKSFAAAGWIDEAALTLKLDARLVFHNPPAWYEAIRVQPRPMPFTDIIPADTVSMSSYNVTDPAAMFASVKDFFLTRAKAAGRVELVEGWEAIEAMLQEGDDALLDSVLAEVGIGMAGFMLSPRAEDNPNARNRNEPVSAGLIGLKNRKSAEALLNHKLAGSSAWGFLSRDDGGFEHETKVRGIAVYHDTGRSAGYAFLDLPEGAGVLLIGEYAAVVRVIEAREDGTTISSLPVWQQVKPMMFTGAGQHFFYNVGALLRLFGEAFSSPRGFWADDRPVAKDRDDTEKDDNPLPYIAAFLNETLMAGEAAGADSAINFRVVVGGVPDRARIRTLLLHFRDVERNRQVRDDLLRVLDGATAHHVLHGELPDTAAALVESGLLGLEEWSIDPFGADDEKPRRYKLAPVPETADIRQAILLAYQPKPGLRGNHLAVLWNGHVVELTPQALAAAIELAAEGKPLPRDGDWYRDALVPLYEVTDPRTLPVVEWWEETVRVAVRVIDDEGNETVHTVNTDRALEETEKILDTRK